MKNQIRIKKIPLSLRNWFHDCFLGTELQAETARMLGVPNDLQSIHDAWQAEYKASLRKAKVSKGFGGKR
jgi:hypothetical protein